jgi:hypothetical protein
MVALLTNRPSQRPATQILVAGELDLGQNFFLMGTERDAVVTSQTIVLSLEKNRDLMSSDLSTNHDISYTVLVVSGSATQPASRI